MPKPIKKKTKPERKPEQEDIHDILQRARGKAAPYGKSILYISIAVAAAVIFSAGTFFYFKSAADNAEKLRYEAYKEYYGLYGTKPVIKAEAIRKALDGFKKSNDLKESAFALYYIANCQYALGNFTEALAVLNELNGKYPEDNQYLPLSYYKMALINLKTGKSDEALGNLDALQNLKTDSLKDVALVEAARVLEKLGKTDEAGKKYEAIVKDFPKSPFFDEAKRKTDLANRSS